ncbi:hypothetical protein ACJ5H2_00590 [Nocardioides sp. R1-1]|uniref:hypothetical protein n=1 Tax=Nocardioides sp. R1-1 TaxID=3383502 RepID=UPI0038D07A8E
MSVRHALLALLRQRPMYGYHLRSEFEQALAVAVPSVDVELRRAAPEHGREAVPGGTP